MFDAAGFEDVIICASSDLDEYLIESLKNQGATINSWGVGTNLITSKDCPAFGGVYKLAGVEVNGELVPKIKLSENSIKITNPGDKTVYRIYDKNSEKAIADLIALKNEVLPEGDLTIFDPINTWKKTKIKADTYTIKEILIPIFINGECVYKLPTITEIKEVCRKELNSLWDEVKRFANPHKYYVDLAPELWNLKMELLNKESK
jgi:nicotinate phosphoribosyltransferase